MHYFTKETAIATLVDCGYKIIDQALHPKQAASKSNAKLKVHEAAAKVCHKINHRDLNGLLLGDTLSYYSRLEQQIEL